MIPMMALRALLLATLAGVQGLSVVSAGDRTNVLIEVDGQVAVQHQSLASPPRIVVDITGADFELPRRRFLNVDRGGVMALRSSQFQPGVVRVVIDLAENVDYQVEQAEGLVRVSFPNAAGPFETWSSGMGVEQAAPAPTPAGEPVGEPVGRPARLADRSAREVAVTQPPVVEAVEEPQQPPIWVEFRNTPITDVLGTFADFSGKSIVPGQGVGGQTITATIQGQPWDEAMRAILTSQGLSARELPSGIVMVASLESQRQRETQEETVTEAFPLRYVSADSIAPQVRRLMGEGEGAQGTVAVNTATNSLIVSARQSVVTRLQGLIPALDRRTPQVTVQVRILSIRRSDFDGYGIHYELKDIDENAANLGNQLNRITPGLKPDLATGRIQTADPGEDVVLLGGNSVAAMGNALERIPQATFEVLTSLLLGRHTLVTWLEAVERLELAELQADPVVTVLDHRTARVHVGERTPIRVVDQGAASAGGPQAQVRTEETGVILELTPHVVGGQVLLQLHAERSEIQSFSVDAGYVFGTSETDTEILLDDGETAVISGLTTTDIRDTREGIPILMDLPVLGGLFRNTFRTEEKEDLLIMVTPYIDRTGGG